ncbi:MAG: hypothetical protein Q8K82_02365 [Gemmatimonadaceae bacterium]|nr:hypothetical protein [Gemmatimonadaceae bacterium]
MIRRGIAFQPGKIAEDSFIMLVAIVSAIGGTGALAVDAAITVRRGLAMRLLGLEILTRRGERAERFRLRSRPQAVWLSTAIRGALTIFAARPDFSPTILAAGAVAIGITLKWLLVVVRTPGSSLAERLSGRMIVPEQKRERRVASGSCNLCVVTATAARISGQGLTGPNRRG